MAARRKRPAKKAAATRPAGEASEGSPEAKSTIGVFARLGLVALVCFLSGLYFLMHLQSTWIGLLASIGPVVLGALAIALSGLKAADEAGEIQDIKARVGKAIRHNAVVPVLAALTVLLVAALLTTSSIHLVYEGADAPALTVSIQRSDGSEPQDAKVSTTQQHWSRIYPFGIGRSWGAVELEFSLFDPGEQVSKTAEPVTLSMWSAVTVGVPRSFSPIPLHILRLVPAKGLYDRAAAATGEAVSDLTVSIEAPPGSTPVEIPNLRKRAYVFGAQRTENARWLLTHRESEASRHAEFDRYLAQFGSAMPASILEKIRAAWSTDPDIRTELDLAEGDEVRVRVHEKSAAGTTVVFDELLIVGDKAVQTIYLEKNR